MFDGPGLAVSLPAGELARDPPPASVFDADFLAGARISSDLRVAIGLIEAACRRREIAVRYVARPEIFTHGASLAWLRDRLGTIDSHLCLSDGLAVRIIPQMRNHLFLYRQGIRANAEAFLRLRRRVPELLATLHGQVNTAYGVTHDRRPAAPPGLILAGEARAAAPASFFRFYLDRRSAGDSAAASVALGPADPAAALARCTALAYLPLNDLAARHRCYADAVAAILLRAFFDPTLGVVLRLPHLPAPGPGAAADGDGEAAARIALALSGLCVARVLLPRVAAETILFTTDDADPTMLHAPGMPVRCMAHETFDFWRHPPAFYAGFAAVTVWAPRRRRAERAGIQRLLRGLLGRAPDLCWLAEETEDEP